MAVVVVAGGRGRGRADKAKVNDDNFGHIDGKGLLTQTTEAAALTGKLCFAFNDNVIKRRKRRRRTEREAN